MAVSEQKMMWRWYLVASASLLFGLACIVRLYQIQVKPQEVLRAELPSKALPAMTEVRPMPAHRGNIYAADGRLLATSQNLYDLSFDPTVASSRVFERELPGLAARLSERFGKPAEHYIQRFRAARRDTLQYIPIAYGLNYSQAEEFRSYPLFNLGRRRGGFCEYKYEERLLPLGEIAKRTIGADYYDPRNNVFRGYGLEGSYGPEILRGTMGKRVMQRIQDGSWKPVDTEVLVRPSDGMDLVSSLDTDLQQYVHQRLSKGILESDAAYGCAIVMEIKTGQIRCVVNLEKVSSGEVRETLNYAVGGKYAPGSTFKLMSLVAALEAGKADTSRIVDTSGGMYFVKRDTVKDSRKGGYGRISLGRAFVVSSNTAFAKLIDQGYDKHEEQFLNQLADMHLTRKLEVGLRGEPEPVFHYPNDPLWSDHTLPWMAFGYEIGMTPLQVLNFYNAVVNKGEMVRPTLVTARRDRRGKITYYPRQVIDHSICSEGTALKVMDLMRQVVQKPGGTGYEKDSDFNNFGGKTGTTKTRVQNKDKEFVKEYTASFAGFFPANEPKYSAIVVIHNPDHVKGNYYGADVALPVFKDVARYLTLRLPLTEPLYYEEPVQGNAGPAIKIRQAEEWRRLPDLLGLPGVEAIEWLEQRGIEVNVEGSGRVRSQSVPAHTPIREVKSISLKLS